MVTIIAPKHTVDINSTTMNIYHANMGEGLPRHEHTFAHLTIVNVGSTIIRKEGKEMTMTKDSQPVLLTENEWHEIEALEDGTVFVNVFATT